MIDGLVEGKAKGEMGKIRRKIFHRLIEAISKRDMGYSGREFIYRFIEECAQSQVGDRQVLQLMGTRSADNFVGKIMLEDTLLLERECGADVIEEPLVALFVEYRELKDVSSVNNGYCSRYQEALQYFRYFNVNHSI